MLAGVKRPEGVVEVAISLFVEAGSLHVHRSPEGARSVGGATYPALHLNGLHRGGNIRQVNPENALRLGIIVRYAVEGDVDAGGVAATDAHTGITYACSGIGISDYRRQALQQVGHVFSQIYILQIFLFYFGKGKRRLLMGAGAQHHYFILQVRVGSKGYVQVVSARYGKGILVHQVADIAYP